MNLDEILKLHKLEKQDWENIKSILNREPNLLFSRLCGVSIAAINQAKFI